jgi:hypothetical protein
VLSNSIANGVSMPANTIDVSFVQEFEEGVHLAYQRMGSHLRGTIRFRAGVKNKTTFQKMGTGTATQKARNGDVPPMNIDHTNVSVTLEDWYAGEWIDDLDMLRTNHDEMVAAQESGARALGRKSDEQILAAASTTTSASDETTVGATLAWATDLVTKFGVNDVPQGSSDRFVVLDFYNWAKLTVLDQFNRQSYVGDTNVLQKGAVAKEWLGFYWMPFSGIDTTGTNTTCYAYHRSALALAVGADVQSDIQYHNFKASNFALNKMQMNAVLIDERGCFKCSLKKA